LPLSGRQIADPALHAAMGPVQAMSDHSQTDIEGAPHSAQRVIALDEIGPAACHSPIRTGSGQ